MKRSEFIRISLCNHGKNDACLLWPYAARSGYGEVFYEGRVRQVTHVALEMSGRPLVNGEWALHRCDSPACYNPRHLFAGDNAANMADKHAKGRFVHGFKPSGEACCLSKLTEAAVLEIRQLYRPQVRGAGSSTWIAAKFGVTKSAVIRIAQRKTWKHLVTK